MRDAHPLFRRAMSDSNNRYIEVRPLTARPGASDRIRTQPKPLPSIALIYLQAPRRYFWTLS